MQDIVGEVIKTYEIKERIGVGGFGAVFRAVQPTIGREVAVKVILSEHANQPDFIRRFEIEAQLVARLEHPHIVPLYDYWREPNGAYLVMRFLRGGSLRDSLEEQGVWDTVRTGQMLNQIASALAFAHRNGVVHRDLKSDNILIDELGNSYLTDFGIAKDLGVNHGITRDNILGTPAYLSPEQIRGEAASAQTDIYALGIMIFETLTGTKPFFDASPATVLYKQLNDPLPDITELRPDLPDDLNPVLLRATSKDADDRYEQVLDFARDYQNVIRQFAPQSPTTTASTVDIYSLTSAQQVLSEPSNPFKGLRAFQQADADDFFGREALVEELLNNLSITGQKESFLAVVGPSGSGKSSLVKAGLLPRIQNNVLDEEFDWYVTEMVPGTHPFEELEAALLRIAPAEVPGLLEQLKEDTRGLVRSIRRIMPEEDAQIVIFIDQFEETFTLIEDEEERIHFLGTILAAATDQRSRTTIIITIRADFYDRPLLYSKFGELVRTHTELVLPLNDQELRDAINGPAATESIQLEPGLVEAIINDVNERPGALPLLQYALTELFERREGRVLTLNAYQDIGGTTGALARRAEEIYQGFTSAQKSAARQMFLRLVTLGDGTEDTRRRVLQAELLSLGTQSTAMREVIDAFGKYRLLTFDRDKQTRSPTVEVAHEALIRQWQRMSEWLDENRESLRMQRRLSVSAEDWIQSKRDMSYLARGARLQQFEELNNESDLALNYTEAQYLKASIDARQKRIKAEEEQEAREDRLRQQSRRRLRLLAAFMTVAAVIGFILSVLAVSSQQQAEAQAVRASTSEARALDSEAQARDSEAEALNNEGTAIAALAEAEALADQAATSESNAISNQGTAVAALDQVAISANVAAGAARDAQNNANEAQALVLAANARNALTGNDPQLALALALEAQAIFEPVPSEVLRTLSSVAYAPGPSRRFQNHQLSVVSVAFSGDGAYSVSASVDGTIRVWDNALGEQARVITLPEGLYFHDVAVHPRDVSIAGAVSDGTVRLWDFETGEELGVYEGHTDEVLSVQYSPDGFFLLSAGLDRTARLWGLASGIEVQTYTGHTGAIIRAVFSPDGSRIATSSGDATLLDDPFDESDGTVRIWDRETGEAVMVIDPESGFVRSLDYSPDGQTIAYGVWDSTNAGTVRIHDVETGAEVERFFAHTTPLLEVLFNPDGSHILSIAWDGDVRIWDVERGVQVNTFTGFDARLLAAAYNTTGDAILLGTGDVGDDQYVPGDDRSIERSVWLVDVVNGDTLQVFDEHGDWVWAVDIHPEGQLAASAGGPLRLPVVEQGDEVPEIDTDIYLWDIATGELQQTFKGHSDTVDGLDFHPNGRWLLSSSWDGFIILWDIETGERVQLYREHDGRVYKVRFNQDGSRFLSASGDGTVRLWDTETGAVLLTYAEHGDQVISVAFSPDEMQVVSGGYDNQLHIWDIETGERIQTFVGHTSQIHEVLYHPFGDFVASTSWDGTVRLWDVATGAEVRRYSGHNGHTYGLDFSLEGDFLLTSAEDRTVRLWDFETAQELHQFNGHTNWVLESIFSPDNTFALSAAEDDTARVWRMNETAAALTEFAMTNRYIRELTCDERVLYRLEPCADTVAE